jgi:hypothetical protein
MRSASTVGADVMRRKRIEPGQLVDVRLTPQERNLILERTFIDDEIVGSQNLGTLS